MSNRNANSWYEAHSSDTNGSFWQSESNLKFSAVIVWVGVGVEVGEGSGVGKTVWVGEGEGVGVATGFGFGSATPLFHTNFLPLFTQVNFLLALVAVAPALLHLAPAFTAAIEGWVAIIDTKSAITIPVMNLRIATR